MRKIFILCICVISMMISVVSFASDGGEKQEFTITGYYSPLPNQNFYITGSYEAEIRLNGQGIAASDGTPVYSGMIAAPSSYSFGTKICIPNLGCGKIHDRGGAIVKKGERDLARHDRLDVWMGYGDDGLLRALAWGVKHLECEKFTEDSEVIVNMNFDIPPALSEILHLPNRPVFSSNLWIGNSGEKVIALQKALNELGFYGGLLDGKFNQSVEDALLLFQQKNFIVEDENAVGAGVFGPQTRSKITSILYSQTIQSKISEAWNEFHFDKPLKTGLRNQGVFKIQQMLVKNEFLTVHPTGYFGPLTKEALIEFQIFHKIIKNSNDSGAGLVGPRTREFLNEFLAEEKNHYDKEKQEELAYKKQRNALRQVAGMSPEFFMSYSSIK